MKTLLAKRLLNILTALQSIQNGNFETASYIEEPKLLIVTTQKFLFIFIIINIYEQVQDARAMPIAIQDEVPEPTLQENDEHDSTTESNDIILSNWKRFKAILKTYKFRIEFILKHFQNFIFRPRLMPIIGKRMARDSFEMPNIDKMWKRSGMSSAILRPDKIASKWNNFPSRIQELIEDPKFSKHLRKLIMSLKKKSILI